jgi:hypothetical protein
MGSLKGAFINMSAGLLGALPNIVVFQFNPANVTRTPTLAQQPPRNDGSGTQNGLDQPGRPTETYSFSLRFDATDQLANGNPLAAASGILPMLSALEQLMQPKSSSLLNFLPPIPGLGGDAAASSYDCPPTRLPMVYFFWGPYRIWPVNITSLAITETEYNVLLVPVRADVAVNLTVLTPAQLSGETFATAAYDYSQGVREVMATLNLANSVEFGVSSVMSLSI